jgi:small GTP-binding protein
MSETSKDRSQLLPTGRDPKLKIVVLGDSVVGKSNLISCYVDNLFTEKFISTIGADVKTQIIDINKKRVKHCFLDTAGQEKFDVITNSFYGGSDGILIVLIFKSVKQSNQILARLFSGIFSRKN